MLAARVLARDRGVVASESWVRLAFISAARMAARICAVPVGALLGIYVGTFVAPALLVVRGEWVKRIALFVLSPFFGLYFGVSLGFSYLSKGKVDKTLLVAKAFHKYAPIFTLPKALTHQGLGLVVVTRHRDVRDVLARDDVFRVDLYDERMRAAAGAFFLGMDASADDPGKSHPSGCSTPPGVPQRLEAAPTGDYDRERALGAAALGRDEAHMKESVGRMAQALVNGALGRPTRTLDVVSEFAHAVQLNLIKEYFGISDTSDERLLGWLETMSFFIFNFWVGGPYRTLAVRAGSELSEHLHELVRERVAEMAHDRPIVDDVVGRMVLRLQAASQGQPIDEALAVRCLAGLISGATVPTIGTLVQVVDRLLDLPAPLRNELKKASLTQNDAVVRRFVREAARFSAYPPTLYRHAASAHLLCPGTDREKSVEQGAWVVMLPILANFDESIFPNPEVFDPYRNETEETAPLLFGWARHRCLGEHMAELVIVEMVKRLFSRDVERAPGSAGRIQKGEAGKIPDGDYARRLIVHLE